LDKVDVIIYTFALTKSGHLRKSTINMIKEKLKMRSTGKVCCQTRSWTHDLADVGLHLDEDNALINSSKEDESSNMFISGSNSKNWDIIGQFYGFNCITSLYSIFFVM
jgi:hypothetical protein